LFLLIKYECLQHRNKHEHISDRKQQIGFFCYDFKSVFTVTGGLSAGDVLERWCVDELEGRLWSSALCSHALVIWRPTAKWNLWVLQGSKKKAVLDNWFVFQCLSKRACHARWSTAVTKHLL